MKYKPVIVQADHQYGGSRHEHWVLVTGKIGGDYTINDPSKAFKEEDQKTKLSQYGDIYALRVFKSKNGGCR